MDENEESNEEQLERLTLRRDEITSNPEEFVVNIQNKILKSLDSVRERIEDMPNTSMWEHLQHLLWRTEECSQDVIDEEIARIDKLIKSLED